MTTPLMTELAKSFEPASIEAHWYPEWEKRGYFRAGSWSSEARNEELLLNASRDGTEILSLAKL